MAEAPPIDGEMKQESQHKPHWIHRTWTALRTRDVGDVRHSDVIKMALENQDARFRKLSNRERTALIVTVTVTCVCVAVLVVLLRKQ